MPAEVKKQPVYGRPNEVAVSVAPGELDGKIVIHPWDRDDGRDKSVYVELDALGYTVTDIFNREDFVEGLLAVFPELRRA